MTKIAAIVATVAVVVGLGITAAVVLLPSKPENCGSTTIAGGPAMIGGPFTLVDQTGKTVTEADIITGPTLIYFGYTFCPDVCPLDTARNAEAVDILDAQGITVKPVFISIDPNRDTPEVLADFVEVIHPRMVGLTGTPEQVDAASKTFKTYYRKNGDGEDYLMDHTTFTYLMGKDGFWDFYRRDATPQAVADSVACQIRNHN